MFEAGQSKVTSHKRVVHKDFMMLQIFQLSLFLLLCLYINAVNTLSITEHVDHGKNGSIDDCSNLPTSHLDWQCKISHPGDFNSIAEVSERKDAHLVRQCLYKEKVPTVSCKIENVWHLVKRSVLGPKDVINKYQHGSIFVPCSYSGSISLPNRRTINDSYCKTYAKLEGACELGLNVEKHPFSAKMCNKDNDTIGYLIRITKEGDSSMTKGNLKVKQCKTMEIDIYSKDGGEGIVTCGREVRMLAHSSELSERCTMKFDATFYKVFLCINWWWLKVLVSYLCLWIPVSFAVKTCSSASIWVINIIKTLIYPFVWIIYKVWPKFCTCKKCGWMDFIIYHKHSVHCICGEADYSVTKYTDDHAKNVCIFQNTVSRDKKSSLEIFKIVSRSGLSVWLSSSVLRVLVSFLLFSWLIPSTLAYTTTATFIKRVGESKVMDYTFVETIPNTKCAYECVYQSLAWKDRDGSPCACIVKSMGTGKFKLLETSKKFESERTILLTNSELVQAEMLASNTSCSRSSQSLIQSISGNGCLVNSGEPVSVSDGKDFYTMSGTATLGPNGKYVFSKGTFDVPEGMDPVYCVKKCSFVLGCPYPGVGLETVCPQSGLCSCEVVFQDGEAYYMEQSGRTEKYFLKLNLTTDKSLEPFKYIQKTLESYCSYDPNLDISLERSFAGLIHSGYCPPKSTPSDMDLVNENEYYGLSENGVINIENSYLRKVSKAIVDSYNTWRPKQHIKLNEQLAQVETAILDSGRLFEDKQLDFHNPRASRPSIDSLPSEEENAKPSGKLFGTSGGASDRMFDLVKDSKHTSGYDTETFDHLYPHARFPYSSALSRKTYFTTSENAGLMNFDMKVQALKGYKTVYELHSKADNKLPIEMVVYLPSSGYDITYKPIYRTCRTSRINVVTVDQCIGNCNECTRKVKSSTDGMWNYFCQDSTQRPGCNAAWCINSGGATCGACRNVPDESDCITVVEVQEVIPKVVLCYTLGNSPRCKTLAVGDNQIADNIQAYFAHDSSSGEFKVGDLIGLSQDRKLMYTGNIAAVGDGSDIFGHPQNLMSNTTEHIYDRYDPSSINIDWSFVCHIFAEKEVSVSSCFKNTFHMLSTLKKRKTNLALVDSTEMIYKLSDDSMLGTIDINLALSPTDVKWVNTKAVISVSNGKCKGCRSCLLGLHCTMEVKSSSSGAVSVFCDGIVFKTTSLPIEDNSEPSISGSTSSILNSVPCKLYSGNTILTKFAMDLGQLSNEENLIVANTKLSNSINYIESSISFHKFLSLLTFPLNYISSWFSNSYIFLAAKICFVIIIVLLLCVAFFYFTKALKVVKKLPISFTADKKFSERARNHIFNRKFV